jgi:hypothetical protein
LPALVLPLEVERGLATIVLTNAWISFAADFERRYFLAVAATDKGAKGRFAMTKGFAAIPKW